MEKKNLSEALEEALGIAAETSSEIESFEDGMDSVADIVRLAQLLLQSSRDLARLAVEVTGDAYAERYLVDQLSCMADNNHHFMSRDFNYDNWLERLEGGEDEEEEDVE